MTTVAISFGYALVAAGLAAEGVAVERAREHGIRIGCFRPPSTPDGSSRLRLTAHADHGEHDLDR